jgi:hypothetical protein
MLPEGIVSLTIGVIMSVILIGLGYFACYYVHILIPNKKVAQGRKKAELPKYKTIQKDYGNQLRSTVPELNKNTQETKMQRNGKIIEKKE